MLKVVDVSDGVFRKVAATLSTISIVVNLILYSKALQDNRSVMMVRSSIILSKRLVLRIILGKNWV